MKSHLQVELKQRIKQGRLAWHSEMTCTWCERRMEEPSSTSLLAATKDHPQPKSKGVGGTTVWACARCNFLKGDMSYDAWKLFMEMHTHWWATDYKSAREMQRENNMQLIRKEEDATVVPLKKIVMDRFQVVAGGLPPSTGNWLMDLSIGTRFTVRSRTNQKNFMCLDLEIISKTPRTVMLDECSTGQPFGGNGRVDPLRFVQEFDKVEVLPSYEEMLASLPQQEETTETINGSDRTNRPDTE